MSVLKSFRRPGLVIAALGLTAVTGAHPAVTGAHHVEPVTRTNTSTQCSIIPWQSLIKLETWILPPYLIVDEIRASKSKNSPRAAQRIERDRKLMAFLERATYAKDDNDKCEPW